MLDLAAWRTGSLPNGLEQEDLQKHGTYGNVTKLVSILANRPKWQFRRDPSGVESQKKLNGTTSGRFRSVAQAAEKGASQQTQKDRRGELPM